MALYYSLTNVGLEFTTPGTAALSNAALPALTAISGLFILRERLARFVAADDSLPSAEQVVPAAGEQTSSLGWSEG